jgi:Xaa-Pro aminopeptidase
VLWLDPPDLVELRSRRLLVAANAMELDTWVFTRSRSVRFASGVRSSEIDLIGEQMLPTIQQGWTIVEAGPPLGSAAFVELLLDLLPERGRVAIDRLSVDNLHQLKAARPKLDLVDAGMLLAQARTPLDSAEIAVMTSALGLTEAAFLASIRDVDGSTERELACRFQRAAFDAGLELQTETVFSVVPRRSDDAAWKRGEWADAPPYRGRTTDRSVTAGDIVAFDGGGDLDGYASDLGWCFLAGDPTPSPEQRELGRRWEEVAHRVMDAARPGASSAELEAAARCGWEGSDAPWPRSLYVAHGIGTDVAQPPFAGADDGTATIDVGHVLMVEPYVYVEGIGGYRAEYCVAIEAGGARILNSQPIGTWAVPS